MRFNAAYLAVILLSGAVPVFCQAQKFSADVVSIDSAANNHSRPADPSVHSASRIFVNEARMRLELGPPAGTVLLANAADQTAFALFPAKKEYEPLAGGLSEYFRVSDVENACSDWQATSAQKLNCEKVGHEIVEGRHTVKYHNKTASDVAISAVWIDEKLKFVVKWEGAGTGVELHNIQEAEQPSDLFTLPADYQMPKPRKGTNKGFGHQ
jgi:hypothetical protein